MPSGASGPDLEVALASRTRRRCVCGNRKNLGPSTSHEPPVPSYTVPGGEKSPVTFPAFKAGDSVLRGSNGGFDSHTLPPYLTGVTLAPAGRCQAVALHVARSSCTLVSVSFKSD